jgi:intein/homing endonuclease
LTSPTIINGVEFVPRPDIVLPGSYEHAHAAPGTPVYKNDYTKIPQVIEDESLWHKALNVKPGTPLTKEQVERALHRHMIMTDLFFIVHFVIGIKTANRVFVVRQCQEVENGPRTKTLDVWARYHYKAVDVEEIVPTPDGWVRHGDLKQGDYVFSPSGRAVKVVAKTPVFYNADCYRVTFRNGYSVVVSGDHLWSVEKQCRKRVKTIDRRFKKNRGIEKIVGRRVVRETSTICTRDLASRPLKKSWAGAVPIYAVRYNSGLELPEANLPIEPYILGYWLGNGTSSKAEITCHSDDASFIMGKITEAGHKARIVTYRSDDVNKKATRIHIDTGNGNPVFWYKLKALNLANNKHIPKEYLRASVSQRLKLLQGLMDSDGSLHSCGTAYFVNINEDIANGVFELSTSLGLRASIVQTEANIKFMGDAHYKFYRVSIQPRVETPPFLIERKSKDIRYSNKGKTIRKYNYISKVEPVSSIPVSCIQVDSPDGLYLIGKHMVATHNSTIITVSETVQYHLKNPEECTCIFSYKKPAAEDFVDSIRKTYEKPIIKFAFPDVVYDFPQSEAPSWSLQNGITLKRKNTSRKEKTVEASGLVEGMVTGGHFERRIFDDIETFDIRESLDEQNKAYSAFEMASYLGTGNDSDIEREIGTFYSYNGPNVRIRDQKKPDGTPVYFTRIIPGTHDGTIDGKPVLMSQEKLEEEKLKEHFNSQILCDPSPKEARKLNPNFLIEVEPEMIPRNVLKFMIIDPAGDDKGKGGTDWAILIIGVDPKPDDLGQSNNYLLNAIIEELKETEAPETIARLYLASGIIQKVGVEKVAQSTTEIHVANALAMRGRRISIEDGTLVILSPQGREKNRRIVDNLGWPLNNSKLHMSKSVPQKYRDRIRMEMDKFPVWKKDGIDAWAYIFDILKKLDLAQLYTLMNEYSFEREPYKMKTPIG